MFSKDNQFVINLKKRKKIETELIGAAAEDITKIIEQGVSVPPVVVITTNTFDEFLVANNLVDKILTELGKVQPFEKKSAEEANRKIKQMVLSAKIQNYLWQEIKLGIMEIGELNETELYDLSTSHIIEESFVPEESRNLIISDVAGEEEMKIKLKEIWASMFSTESIEQRANRYYDGPLSVAVVVQRVQKLELSGKYFSVVPKSDEKDVALIQAVYGISEDGDKKRLDTEGDQYIVKLKNMVEILQKNILPQKKMKIYRGKVEQKGKHTAEIEISEEWQQKQKLDDGYILKLLAECVNLEKIHKHPIEVNWGIEAGEITVFNVKKMKKQDLQNLNSEKKPKKKKTKNIPTTEDNLELKDQDTSKSKEDIDTVVESTSAASIGSAVKKQTGVAAAKLRSIKNRSKGSAKDTEVVHTVDELQDELEGVMGKEMKADEEEKENKINVSKIKKAVTLLKLNRKGHPDADEIDERISAETSILLDVSRLTATKIKTAKHFSGAFLDATSLVVHHGELPEQKINNSKQYTDLIESYLLDISTLKSSIHSKEIIYQFSTITEKEIDEMNKERKERKIRMFDSFFGDERFIAHPEAMVAEAIALKRAKRKNDGVQMNISFPSVRSISNLEDMKTIVESQGILRGDATKFYAEVSIPSFAIDLRNLEEEMLDGLIIDYDTLLALTVYRTQARKVDHDVLFNVIRNIVDMARIKELEVIVRLHGFEKQVIRSVLGLRPEGLIFSSIPQRKTIRFIESFEKGITKIK